MNDHNDTSQSPSVTSYRGRGGCLLTIGVTLSGVILAGATLGTQDAVLQPDAWPISVAVAKHQDAIALAVFGTVLVVSVVLRLLTRQALPPVGPAPQVVPEKLSPAIAYALATRREPEEDVVLPVLLDLIDRGYYDATLGQPGPEGGPVDLVLAKPSRRPAGPDHVFERDTITVFDALLRGGPGLLTTLHTRVREADPTLRAAWKALEQSLRQIPDQEFERGQDLRPVRNGLMVIAAAVLFAGGVLAERHTSDTFAFFVAFPITMAVGFLVPSRFLTVLTPASLQRHARWKDYAEDLARRRTDGSPRSVPAETWSHDLGLALVFSAVDAHWCNFTPAPGGNHWASGLGETKLVMLDHYDAATAFGHAYDRHFDPPPAD